LLAGGRLLVAEHWPKRITERDRTGKIIRETKLEDYPVSCQRLANGNTFIATYNTLMELNREGKQIYSMPTKGGMIYYAQKLPSGGILCINSTGVVTEYGKDRKEVLSFTPGGDASGASYWASVVPLRGGKYLITLAGNDRVIETDRTGKVLWEAKVKRAGWAVRLRNGRTLVASSDGRFVVELNAAGKEVWRIATKFRAFCARRY
jgi:outer membrane protein assembly factor BamB